MPQATQRFELRTQAERVEQAQLEDAQRLGARRRGLERREEGHEQLEDRGSGWRGGISSRTTSQA